MKLKRVMIAAPKSGSGKTTITCALLQLLKDSGFSVASYKCGPDYIDPMFHKKVLGIPSKNLDTFFTDAETTKRLFLQGRKEDDFAVLEGVMGLYDGLGGVREEGSSYHLAQVTETPIILVVDSKGMGRSIVAQIAGFLAYDTDHLIKGIILNRMSKPYYDILKPVIEEELKISVLGYFPEKKSMRLESRHLGLQMPDELQEIQSHLKEIAEELLKTVSLDKIVEITGEAEEIVPITKFTKSTNELSEGATFTGMSGGNQSGETGEPHPVIAVAKDEAFCFYYEDNLRLLEEFGAKLTYFSPVHDVALPEECAGILLGGGYPELYVKELSSNEPMRNAMKQAFASGVPMVAECGGFMYLHESITDLDRNTYPMAGVLTGTCDYKGKLVRFGYINIEEDAADFLPEGEIIRAHEFHYYDSTDNGASCTAKKPLTGRTYPCIMSGETYWFGFPHLYYPSNPAFAENFVKKARAYKGKRNF